MNAKYMKRRMNLVLYHCSGKGLFVLLYMKQKETAVSLLFRTLFDIDYFCFILGKQSFVLKFLFWLR